MASGWADFTAAGAGNTPHDVSHVANRAGHDGIHRTGGTAADSLVVVWVKVRQLPIFEIGTFPGFQRVQ